MRRGAGDAYGYLRRKLKNMTEKELEDEMFQYEDEYADMCEFNNFSDDDSKKYLKKIEEIQKKLRDLRNNL